MQTITNGKLSVSVDELGAELRSIYSHEREMEYMWQPGLETWDHSSLLLFPNPARICHDRTIIGGKIYPATMQGFAKDSVFEVENKKEDSMEFVLRANERTRRYFPFEFCLRVVFRLEGEKLIQEFHVSCEGDKTMYFGLGAHPGFYMPLVLGETGDDYIIRFDRPQHINHLQLQEGSRLLTGEKTPYLYDATDVQLCEGYFNNGPMLLDGVDADSVMLLSKKSGRYVKLGIKGFPYMCLWGNPYKNFLMCIEPWCGTTDLVDTDHIWETKPGYEHVEPGEEFVRVLTFEVG